MKSSKFFATVTIALAGVALFTPSLAARTCSGDGDVVGTYSFSASRSGFFLLDATAAAGSSPLIPVSSTPPGTNATATATQAFVGSGTAVGALVAGLNNPSVFSTVGRLYADGAGNLYASPTIGLPSNVLTGSYNVSSDCSITVTLYDPFTPGPPTGSITTTTTSATGITTTTTTPVVTPSGLKAGIVNLQGELLNSAQQIELASAGASGAGVLVNLTKGVQASACSNASLSGNYTITGNGFYLPSAGNGLVTNTGTTTGTGIGTTTGTVSGTTTSTGTTAAPSPATTCTTAASGVITTSTTINGTTTTGTATNCITPAAGAFLSGATGQFGTPFNLLGRFVADGNGNFVNDNASVQSPLTASLLGTYTVNADCTGTARLNDQNNISRGVNFVLSNTASPTNAATQNGGVQQLQFVFSDTGVFGSGTATPQ